MSDNKRSRSWCITEHKNFNLKFEDAEYWIIGQEIGKETKKEHLQCYVYYKDARSFTAMKKDFPTSHIEAAKGSPWQNRQYCIKDGTYTEGGQLPQQGKRTDISDFMEAIRSGMDDIDLSISFPSCFARYLRSIDRLRKAVLAKKHKGFSPVEVYVYYGAAGVGKTSKVEAKDPDVYHVTTDALWWDGYNGQEAILFDDFYGGIKYCKLLKLLDGYKFQLPVKGGFTWKCWKRVYITSNVHPEKWYQRGLTPALSRRMKIIEEIR